MSGKNIEVIALKQTSFRSNGEYFSLKAGDIAEIQADVAKVLLEVGDVVRPVETPVETSTSEEVPAVDEPKETVETNTSEESPVEAEVAEGADFFGEDDGSTLSAQERLDALNDKDKKELLELAQNLEIEIADKRIPKNLLIDEILKAEGVEL